MLKRVVAVGLVDVGFGGDVLEGAVAAIVVENVFRRGQSARAAHHRRALPDARGTISRRGRGREIEVNVIRNDEIELAVTIVVHEGAAAAPGFARASDAGFVGDIGEDAVIVVVETVLAVVGDVEIVPAVVVVVTDADALSPAGRAARPAFCGHVGEGAVVIVAIEMVRRSFAALGRFQRRAVHDEDVRPAIVVVVEDGDAGACGLDDVLLAVDAAEDLRHRESGFLGNVHEVGDWLRWRRRSWRGGLRQHGIRHGKDEDKNGRCGNEMPDRIDARNREHADSDTRLRPQRSQEKR